MAHPESKIENPKLPLAQYATLACLWEVSAPKPGNVHRGADFEDSSFEQFITAAVAIGPAMEAARVTGVGAAVETAVGDVAQWVGINTHLGTILLLAPLAAAAEPGAGRPLRGELARVLQNLTPQDARRVYQAIRMAAPGGLGTSSQMDVYQSAPEDLLAAMRTASSRDLVAAQYANGFAQVWDVVCPAILDGQRHAWPLPWALVHAQLVLMAQFPDSLIGRKCGAQLAQQAADRAAWVLEAGGPTEPTYRQRLADLDFWLRCDGHRRNPGTSADMIAAGLFALLCEGQLAGPVLHRFLRGPIDG